MRNLKRVLALALALVMVIGMMVIGASAASYTDAAAIDADYAEAVEVLTGMGVFKGQGTGFAPKATLSRAEAAALIYRVITADVKDSKISLYDYSSFADVAEGNWATGYITYAANGGYVKGDGTGNFLPDAKVTGVQVLAIMLRAAGYGQKGEFEGAAWKDNVLTTADDLGLLDNIKANDLDKAATRELVAQLIWDSMWAPTTTYTPAFGYWPSAVTLGDKFGLDYVETTDDWGRPGYKFVYNTGDKATSFAIDPLATHVTATTDCVVAQEMGLKQGDHNVKLWVNGVDYTRKINMAADYDVLGAQGVLVEVYADRIVLIDTYLAKVGTAHPAVYDKSGHQVTPAYTDILVYNRATDNVAVGTPDTLNGVGYTFGSYILVNINNGKNYTVSLGEAAAITGAQTLIWQNIPKHTVAGTTYDDAVYFNLDQAKNDGKAQYTWYFDQYGNLIGATEIKAVYTYATIKDIQWMNPQSAFGYAQATLVYVDGTTEVVVVDSIGTTELKYSMFAGDYSQGGVSANYGYNASYIGQKLFAVAKDAQGVAYLTEVTPAITGATVTSKVPTIIGTGTCYVDDSTQFLVRTGAVAYAYNWNTVAGYNQMPSLTNATVYYVNLDGDAAAEYVYMYGAPATSAAAKLVYVANTSYNWVAGTTDFITLKGAEVQGTLTDVVVNDEWLDGENTELKAKTLYYMVDANGDGKIDTNSGDAITEIGTTEVALAGATKAIKLAAGSYKVLNNAIQTNTTPSVDYNHTNATVFGTFTGAENIVIVYTGAAVSAIYVL